MKKLIQIALIALLASCTQKGATAPRSDTAPVSSQKFRTENLLPQNVSLEFPWGLAFLPDGSALVTEKPGRLRIFKDGALSEPLIGLPQDILYDGQGGLFDVVVDPDFARNHFIYLSYAKGEEKSNGTALYRAKLAGNQLLEGKIIFEANPKKKGSAHFGGRILFLNDNTLLLSLGEGYDYRDEAQNLESDLGKIVAIDRDGEPKANINGFARRHIFSYGHRNPQGLAYDKVRHIIYENEHGPRGGDEINILSPGRNYGWPKITYGIDYTGMKISDYVALDGMEQPITYWVPSIAPSSMVFYEGQKFPNWQGDLIVSALAGQQLRRVNIENGRVIGEEIFLNELNHRYRNIAIAPDGALWVLTDSPEGQIIRIIPQ